MTSIPRLVYGIMVTLRLTFEGFNGKLPIRVFSVMIQLFKIACKSKSNPTYVQIDLCAEQMCLEFFNEHGFAVGFT